MTTIYALVRIDSVPNQFGCHIYSKQTSNFDKMVEYKEEISKKYPSAKIVLTTRENAKEMQKEYRKMWKEYEEISFNLNYQKALMNKF